MCPRIAGSDVPRAPASCRIRPRGTPVLCFLFAWDDFHCALILTRTEAMTAPVAVVSFMDLEGREWRRIAAGGTMVMVPVLVFRCSRGDTWCAG